MAQLRSQILLVEDDDAIRETLSELLADEGFDVRAACHGKKAIDMLACGCQPQLILLDLMMPVMDGWQTLRALRAHRDHRHIPVVIISAARDGMPEGATDFVRKPVDLDHLIATIESFCSADLAMAEASSAVVERMPGRASMQSSL